MAKGKVEGEPEEGERENPEKRTKDVEVPEVNAVITDVPPEVDEEDVKDLARLLYGE